MSLFDAAFDAIQNSIQGNDGETLLSSQEDAEHSCVVGQGIVEEAWRRAVERLRADHDECLRVRRLFLLAFSRCVQCKNATHKLCLHFIRSLNFAARPGAPQGTYVSPVGARVIGSVGDSLNSLVLRGCRSVTNAHMAELRGLRRLAILDVSGTSVGDNGVRELCAVLPQLEALSCASTGITDTSCTHLRRLSKLVRLDLSMTKVSDAGIEALCNSSNGNGDGGSSSSFLPLDTVSLGFTRVTLECLPGLMGLPRLRSVDFRGCEFTLAQLKARAAKLAKGRSGEVLSVCVEVPLLLSIKRSAPAPRMRLLPTDSEEESVWRVSFIRQLIAQGTLEESKAPRAVRSTSFVGSPWKQRKSGSAQELLSPASLKRRNSSEILFGEMPLSPSTPKRRPSIVFTTSPCTPGSAAKAARMAETKKCHVLFPRRSLFESSGQDGDETEKESISGSDGSDIDDDNNNNNGYDEFDVIDDIPLLIKK